MEISLRHIGSANGKPAKLIEMIVDNYDTVITQDITSLNGEVDVNLIMALREIANELEEQNQLIAESK